MNFRHAFAYVHNNVVSELIEYVVIRRIFSCLLLRNEIVFAEVYRIMIEFRNRRHSAECAVTYP